LASPLASTRRCPIEVGPRLGAVMRAGLAVYRAERDPELNLDRMTRLAERAADDGADLVLFAEAAPTGFVNTDDAAHDLALGQAIPGALISRFAALSRRLGIWLAFGLYERAGGSLYDSAVLLDPAGVVQLHYRRIDPHWHGAAADPAIYRQGRELHVIRSAFGTLSFLICGDLFNDSLMARVREAGPDILLVPFARGFDSQVADEAEWEATERAIYAEQVRQTGAIGLLTNGYSDSAGIPHHFGGAFAVDRTGDVLKAMPIKREGVLLIDLPPP
jgi:N-carbamoylputrescine amidase